MGRKRRQAEPDEQVFFEDLVFTEEEISFCNNRSSCLFDLRLTGDAGVAMQTMAFAVETVDIQEQLGTKTHTTYSFGLSLRILDLYC